MKKTMWSFILAGAALISFSGCSPKETNAEAVIDFRNVQNLVGFKGTMKQVMNFRFKDNTGTLRQENTVEMELVSIEGDVTTWKYLKSRNSTATGSMNGPDNLVNEKDRLVLVKTNKDGVISTEGENPDEMQEHWAPQKGVKVGESWNGNYVDPKSKKIVKPSFKYTLTEILEINGRQMTILTSEPIGEGPKSVRKLWVDVKSGVIAKSIAEGEALARDGTITVLKEESHFIDSQGKRWVD